MHTYYRAAILFAFALGLGLYVAYLAREVLLLVYVSALFAVVISPAIQLVRRVRIGKWRPSRGISILIILVGGLALVTLLLVVVIPPIIRDAQGLAAEWPQHAATLSEKIRNSPLARNLDPGIIDPSIIRQHAASAIGGAVGVFKKVAGGLFGFFSFLILTAYFVVDGERAFDWAVSLAPRGQQARLRLTLVRAESRMRLWLVGQGALMLILGTLTLIVFGILKIKYFSALAVFAALTNFIPIIGPLASFALSAVVAALDSPGKLLAVVIFYVAYQQLESAFLTPRIMKTTVDLPALAVIIALALGGTLAGVLGALIAVPSAALAAVLIDEYLVKKDGPVPKRA
ncbi:MAG: AI-2E family transporter [Acidobacteriales bacterium]|nr:AI-2E family transporter [Terriglobales bacterium]